jgi:hypothetical protein
MHDHIVEPEIKDIIVPYGNTVNYSSNQYKNGVLLDMSGMQMDIDIEDLHGNIVKSYSSSGVSPAVTISTTSYNIWDLSPLVSDDLHRFTMRLTEGDEIKTSRKGYWIIKR